MQIFCCIMIGQSLLLVTLKFVFVVVYSEQMPGVVHNLSQAESNNCSCLGDTLIFECTVMRGTATIWTGSAFNCTNTNNEVYLLESDYNRTSADTIATCNDGVITGQVVGVEDSYYTSQLNITLSSDMIGKTIECVYSDGIRNSSIMDTIMNLLQEYPPPEKLSISHVDLGLKQITFSWNPVAPDCPTIHYNILASNCGSCLTTTKHTTVTCTNVHSGGMCTFGVQTVLCGNIIGNVSEHLEFDVTETFNVTASSNKVDTSSISIFIVGVSALLITIIVIVILACYWLHKRSSATKTSSGLSETTTKNSDSDSSPPQQSHHATSQQEDKDTYEYSQLIETPVNLKRLLEKLQGQTSKQWYQFGLTLGLPMDVLEGFNLYSEDDCLAEVLDYWLKHHPGKPTWQEITDAQKKIEMFNIEQDTVIGMADKKAATASDIPPPKPPRRTSSVTMKKSEISPSTETATGDPGHEYEVIH